MLLTASGEKRNQMELADDRLLHSVRHVLYVYEGFISFLMESVSATDKESDVSPFRRLT